MLMFNTKNGILSNEPPNFDKMSKEQVIEYAKKTRDDAYQWQGRFYNAVKIVAMLALVCLATVPAFVVLF